jgi:AraC-like DNA-binding protein
LEVWDAHSVSPATRLDYMRTAITDTIAPFDVHTAPDLVGGRFRAADVGMVKLVTWTSVFEEAEVVRSSRLVRRSDPELCKIDVAFDGCAVFEQHDRQAALAPGDFSFADLSRPCRLSGQLRSGAAVLFPRALLPLRDKDVRNLAGLEFSGREPDARLVSVLVREMARDVNAYEGVGGSKIGAAVLDLIVAVAAARLDRVADVPRPTRRRVLLLSIYAFIEDRLGDPALSPATIAAAHHISLRYLHKMFESEGKSVASWVRALRLERCRRDLLDPALTERPVNSIGMRWGFSDAGNFSRLFRQTYGVPPAEFRRMRPNSRSEPGDVRG